MNSPAHATPRGIDSPRPSIKPLWLLVFDLDGTLIDSSYDLCSSVNAALSCVGRRPLSHELVSSFIGDGAATLVERSLRASTEWTQGVSESEVSASLLQMALLYFLEHYRVHKLDSTSTYPGVLPALHALRERHPEIMMAVLTNKPVNPSRDLCSALGLSDFFFENYGGDSFSTKKPSPEGLLALVDQARIHRLKLGDRNDDLSTERVVMIGDSPADVLAARNAGVRSLGCSYGLSPEELRAAAPDVLVSSPSEWIDALEELASKQPVGSGPGSA